MFKVIEDRKVERSCERDRHQYHTYNIFKCALFLCLDDVSDDAVQVQSSSAGMIDTLKIGRQFNLTVFVWVI